MLIATPAAALARFDLGAIIPLPGILPQSSYHANMVNAQLLLDSSGSNLSEPVAAPVGGC
jgi:hypothetical protein